MSYLGSYTTILLTIWPNKAKKEYIMPIPRFIKISDSKYINPEQIIAFKDNEDVIMLTVLGAGVVAVSEPGYVERVRKVLLAHISNIIGDVEITGPIGGTPHVPVNPSLPKNEKLCCHFKNCDDISKSKNLCTLKNGSLTYDCDWRKRLCVKYPVCTKEEKGSKCVLKGKGGLYCYINPLLPKNEKKINRLCSLHEVCTGADEDCWEHYGKTCFIAYIKPSARYRPY